MPILTSDQAEYVRGGGRTLVTDHPEAWVDATRPCPTCKGTGRGGTLLDNPPFVPCPDCIDGRKREALQVATNGNPHDEHQAGCVLHNLPPNELWPSPLNCSCGGVVTFAYATVEVLPVVGPHFQRTEVTRFIVVQGGVVVLRDRDAAGTYIFPDRTPEVGRDWVVLLDNVELT